MLENLFDNVITGADLEQVVFEPPPWVIKHVFQPGLNIMVAPEMSGKSSLALCFCLGVTTGQIWGATEAGVSGGAAYFSYEPNSQEIQNRIFKYLPDSHSPENLRLKFDFPRYSEEGMEALKQWVQRYPDTKLIVLDGLADFLGPDFNHQYARQCMLLGEIRTFALSYNIALLALLHPPKISKDGSYYGSRAVGAKADILLMLDTNQAKRRGKLKITGNNIPCRHFVVAGNEIAPWHLVVEIDPRLDDLHMTDEKAELLSIIKERGPLMPKEITSYIEREVDDSTVRTLLRKLRNVDCLYNRPYNPYSITELGEKALEQHLLQQRESTDENSQASEDQDDGGDNTPPPSGSEAVETSGPDVESIAETSNSLATSGSSTTDQDTIVAEATHQAEPEEKDTDGEQKEPEPQAALPEPKQDVAEESSTGPGLECEYTCEEDEVLVEEEPAAEPQAISSNDESCQAEVVEPESNQIQTETRTGDTSDLFQGVYQNFDRTKMAFQIQVSKNVRTAIDCVIRGGKKKTIQVFDKDDALSRLQEMFGNRLIQVFFGDTNSIILLKRCPFDYGKELKEPPFAKHFKKVEPERFLKSLDLFFYFISIRKFPTIKNRNCWGFHSVDSRDGDMFFSEHEGQEIPGIDSFRPALQELIFEYKDILKPMCYPGVWNDLFGMMITRYCNIVEFEQILIKSSKKWTSLGLQPHNWQKYIFKEFINSPDCSILPVHTWLYDDKQTYYMKKPEARKLIWLMEFLSEEEQDEYQKHSYENL